MYVTTFSIVTVVWNNLAGFRVTESSVIAQLDSNVEWIVIDGGSEDGTLEEIKRTHSEGNCDRFISERDDGIYAAMNKGIELAKSEYVIFMNAGDTFASGDTLKKITAQIEQTSVRVDLAYGDALERNASNQLRQKKARHHRAVTYGMFTHHQAMIYRTAAIRELMYRPRFRIAGDYDLTVRLLAKNTIALKLEFPVCIFEKGGASETQEQTGRRENAQIQREVLRQGRLRILFTQLTYRASSLLRKHAQPIYSVLRYRK